MAEKLGLYVHIPFCSFPQSWKSFPLEKQEKPALTEA